MKYIPFREAEGEENGLKRQNRPFQEEQDFSEQR